MAKLKKHNRKSNDPYSEYNLEKFLDLEPDQLVLELKALIDSLKSETGKRSTFYPEVGTAFLDTTNGNHLMIVESKNDLSVMSDVNEGYVSFRCPMRGSKDFPNWLKSLKDGTIDVVWCPVVGRVQSNDHYMTSWDL